MFIPIICLSAFNVGITVIWTLFIGVFFLIFAGIDCFMVYFLFQKLKIKNDLLNMPTSSIGFAKPGFVKITGKIVPKEKTLTAPFQQKPCVFYDFYVEERANNQWWSLTDDIQSVPFWIEDSTGRCAFDIKPYKTEMYLDEDIHLLSKNTVNEKTEKELLDVLKRNDIRLKKNIKKRNLRFRETSLEPGDEIMALGVISADGSEFLREGKFGILVLADNRTSEDIMKKIRKKIVKFSLLTALATSFALGFVFFYIFQVIL